MPSRPPAPSRPSRRSSDLRLLAIGIVAILALQVVAAIVRLPAASSPTTQRPTTSVQLPGRRHGRRQHRAAGAARRLRLRRLRRQPSHDIADLRRDDLEHAVHRLDHHGHHHRARRGLLSRGISRSSRPAAERARVRLRGPGQLRDLARRPGSARRTCPIFAAFFLFILLSNWSGLIPPVGRIARSCARRPAT